MKPFVSVVIPCRNEVLFIERCLDSILANDYRPMEVIVADGISTDGTRDTLDRLAALDPRLRIIGNPERITPSALNRAIAQSEGEIVVRFDAHAVMPRDYIRRVVELLESSNADNAGGSIRTIPQSSGPFSGPIVAALSSRFGVGNSGFRTTSASKSPGRADTVFGGCWHKSLFDRIGGFNEKLARSQDIEFNLRIARAGGKIMLDPGIVCDYYARSTLRSFWSHNFSNGVWAVLPFGASDIFPVRPRHLIPLAFVASLAVSTFLPFPWSIAIATTYAAVNLAASIQIAIAECGAVNPGGSRPFKTALHSSLSLVLLPVAFASLHLAYGLGSAWGCLQLLAQKLTPSNAPPRSVRRIP